VSGEEYSKDQSGGDIEHHPLVVLPLPQIPPVTTPHTEMVTPLAAETSVHVTWARHVARSDGIRYAHKIVVRKHRGTIPPDILKRRSGNFNISWPGPRYSLTVSFWNHSCFE